MTCFAKPQSVSLKKKNKKKTVKKIKIKQKKCANVSKKKWNCENNKTMVFIVGGVMTDQNSQLFSSQRIFYAMSDELYDSTDTLQSSIWHESKIILPPNISSCQCFILKKKSANPVLTIVGGKYHWEYPISHIVDCHILEQFLCIDHISFFVLRIILVTFVSPFICVFWFYFVEFFFICVLIFSKPFFGFGLVFGLLSLLFLCVYVC